MCSDRKVQCFCFESIWVSIYVSFYTIFKMEEANDSSSKNTIKQLKSVESSDLDDENSKDSKFAYPEY